MGKNKKIKIGEKLYFDTKYQQLFCNEIPIKLSKRELQLLQILLDANGNIVAYEDIEFAIWDEHVTNGALRLLIHRLRKKLDFELIDTFTSFGCRIKIFNN
ncbi:winged helix-turn-helix domain-containing protein [Halarcobacter sp.]|uniref:winged helix-turn-helix domain-containing protein n=1 Tax=Halarcobacter sp. TaxID=2321133 RepID=UPI002AAA8B28|nr:winged helix-turn-helix domain-containing protein [Halarcobacter sp.]